MEGAAAGPLLPTQRRTAPRGPDAEQRSADTGSVSPGLVPDGCEQVTAQMWKLRPREVESLTAGQARARQGLNLI